jgi:hypothetical protein
MRTSTARVPGATSTGRAAIAWAQVGVGKKRSRRAGTAEAEAVPDAGATATTTMVPDVEVAEEGGTPSSVTRSASPGRAREGETRTVGACDGTVSAGSAIEPRKAPAAIARILK